MGRDPQDVSPQRSCVHGWRSPPKTSDLPIEAAGEKPKVKKWECLSVLLERCEEYENSLANMGKKRRNGNKKDRGVTIMRLKEDHMHNVQLKPA